MALPRMRRSLAASLMVKAPAAAKADIDVWGPLPEGHAVMASLKAQFDPDNVLNPGRFAGRL